MEPAPLGRWFCKATAFGSLAITFFSFPARWFCKATAFGRSSGLFVDGFQMKTLSYEPTKSIQIDIIYGTRALRALVL